MTANDKLKDGETETTSPSLKTVPADFRLWQHESTIQRNA